jgi:hypothetical protein
VAQAWHVPPVADIHNNVGFNVVDEVAEPLISLIVEVCVGMTVWDD